MRSVAGHLINVVLVFCTHALRFKRVLHSAPKSGRCIFPLLLDMSEPYSSPPIVLLSASSNVFHAFISPRLLECCFFRSRHPPRFLMDHSSGRQTTATCMGSRVSTGSKSHTR
jgi:hypothetical protein